MNHTIKALFILLLGIKFTLSAFCQKKANYSSEIVHIPSEKSSITVKISYPVHPTAKDKIIIWSTYPLEDEFLPDSIDNPRDRFMPPFLRNKLLDEGYVNVEYVGRMDSIVYMSRHYPRADANTKTVDLRNLLNYIQNKDTFKNKKIVLIGYSEGGDINIRVTSEKNTTIYAMVQLACSALSTKELGDYQKSTTAYRKLLLFVGSDQEYMDRSLNKFSSLDSYHKADWEGIKQFCEENLEPIENHIYKFENMDSIYYHVNAYLQDKWDREDTETKKNYSNNFEKYYHLFAKGIFNMTPQQIAIRKYKPENYYPYVKCPILAVQGTKDERIDCYPSIERMEKLIKEGENSDFHKIILDNYNHSLVKENSKYLIEDAAISEIVNWVENQ